jgi:poly(A) polymerase
LSIQALGYNATVKAIREIARQLSTPIYLVGGALRDALLGFSSKKDLDFIIAGCFDDIVSTFAGRVHGKVIPWDFGQTRVVFRQGDEAVSVDFSSCKGTGILDDLEERDFTINAMAVDTAQLRPDGDAAIIDPLAGRHDLEQRTIRACSPRAFDQDPLRVVRAIRFAGELGFTIEQATRHLLQQKAGLISQVAVERTKREFFMILGQSRARSALQVLMETGVIHQLIPELQVFRGVKQGLPHEHDLLDHSLQTVSELEMLLDAAPEHVADYNEQIKDHLLEGIEEGVTRRSLLMLSGLLHDSGKLKTRQEAHTQITFYGHEQVGARTNQELAARLGLGRRAQKMIELVTGNHMRLLQLARLARITDRAKARALRDMEDTALETLVLAMADSRATSTSPAHAAETGRIDALAAELMSGFFSPDAGLQAQPRVTGQDVMDILGIDEGPQVGEMLREISELERTGDLASKDDALQWLRKKKTSGSE